MSFWDRLRGKGKVTEPVVREIPDGSLTSVQNLRCDPTGKAPDGQFMVGKWGLTIASDPDSQRLARGVLKKSAGKSLRLEPHPEVGHRGVIPSSQRESGYSWINVDVDLRKGMISFHQGGSEAWA